MSEGRGAARAGPAPLPQGTREPARPPHGSGASPHWAPRARRPSPRDALQLPSPCRTADRPPQPFATPRAPKPRLRRGRCPRRALAGSRRGRRGAIAQEGCRPRAGGPKNRPGDREGLGGPAAPERLRRAGNCLWGLVGKSASCRISHPPSILPAMPSVPYYFVTAPF